MEMRKRKNVDFIYIPKYALDLLHANVITLREAVILAQIDNFHYSKEGKLFFGSNAWLAKRINCSTRRVQDCLKHLRDMDLITCSSMEVGGIKRRVIRINEKRIKSKYQLDLDVDKDQSLSSGKTHHGLRHPQPQLTTPIKQSNKKLTEKRLFATDETSQKSRDKKTTKRSGSKHTTITGFNGKAVPVVKRRQIRVSLFDRSIALDLMMAVRPNAKRYNANSIKAQARDIHLLRTIDQVPDEELEQVMEFHCSRIYDKYHPKALNAKSFRQKYDQIKNAYRRSSRLLDETTISDQAMDIVGRLRMLGWRKGSNEQLPSDVQRGLDWVANLRSVLTTTPWTSEVDKMIAQALKERLPRNFVESHYERSHRRLHSWDSWNGDLSLVRMSSTNKECWSVVTSIVEQYAGMKSSTRFIRLLKDYLSES